MGAAIRTSRIRTAGRDAVAHPRRALLRVLALLVLFALGQAALSVHLVRHELSQLHTDTADSCGPCNIAGHMGGAPRPVAPLLPVHVQRIAYDAPAPVSAPAEAPALSFDSRAPPAAFLA
jgi:hypothetical protein